MLCGKVSGVTMFTTDLAVVITTKKGSDAYSLSSIKPRKKGGSICPTLPYVENAVTLTALKIEPISFQERWKLNATNKMQLMILILLKLSKFWK